MNKVQSYKDLIAWQKAMDLVLTAYRLSATFPPREQYGLTAQLRRAAVSIPSNIAEGHGRRTRCDFVRFLDIARASANEVETQVLLAERLEYVKPGDSSACLDLCDEVQRIIKGLIISLERKDTARPTSQVSGLRTQG